jgi:hypothetical protein
LISRGTDATNTELLFEYDKELFSKSSQNNIVIKIVLRPKDISKSIGSIGVTFGQDETLKSKKIDLSSVNFSAETKFISTLTLNFKRVSNGPATIRIQNLGENHYDYLMVRVIPTTSDGDYIDYKPDIKLDR